MPSAKPAAVIILCGGFGQDLAKDIIVDNTNNRNKNQATISGLKRTVVFGPPGEERVCTALVPIHARKAVEYTVRTLEGVRRLHPLKEHVYFVINDIDRPLFLGEVGCLFAEISDLGFSDANIIMNGARKPSEWSGHVADLQIALQRIGTERPAMCISGALAFVPGYNMQRILEHSLIRDRDVIGFTHASDADVGVWGQEPQVLIRPADTVPVPPLGDLQPASSAPSGEMVSEEIMVLKPSTLAGLVGADVPRSGGLPQLAMWLHQQGAPVCGIDLGFGRLRLSNFMSLDYADRFMHYYLWKLKPQGVSTMDGELQEGAEAEAVTSSINRAYATVLEDTSRLTRTVAEFDRLFFGGSAGAATGGTVGMPQYVLPSTFYMTAYRRQAADVMR